MIPKSGWDAGLDRFRVKSGRKIVQSMNYRVFVVRGLGDIHAFLK